MTDGEKAAYIAAFIDGEGHIGLSRIKKTGYYTREITTINTDKALIDAFVAMCQSLGFPTSVYFVERQPPEKDIWRVRLAGSREVYERFEQLIPLQAPRKKTRLRQLIESYEDRDALTLRRRKGDEIACAHCHMKFYESPSLKARFCSVPCAQAASYRRVTKICETCQTPFEVIRAKAKSKFCSLSCSGKAQARRLSELGKRTIVDARRARYQKRINSSDSR